MKKLLSAERSIILCALLMGAFVALPAHGAGFDMGYVARVGDLNADGRQDIYLQYQPSVALIPFDDLTIPVPTSRRKVSEFALQQNASGGFDLVGSVSSSQVAVMRQWPKSTIDVVLGDVNVDRVLDLILQGVGAAIPGAQDAIIYASSAASGPPMGVKSVDSDMKRFIDDVNGFTQNPQHYYDNAWIDVQYAIPWPVNVYDCGGTYYGFLSGDPAEGDAYVYCQYVYTYIDYVVFDAQVLNTNEYSVPAYYITELLAPYLNATGTVTISAADVSGIAQQLTNVFGTTFAPGLVGPVLVEPEQVTRTRWIMAALRVLGRASILIGGLAYPNETASDDIRKPYFPYIHYSYRSNRFSLLSGLRANTYVAMSPVVPGATAQQVYALPIHDALDSPPEVWFLVMVADDAPRNFKLETPITVTGYGLTRQRTGGGQAVLLLAPTPPGQITGPFKLPP